MMTYEFWLHQLLGIIKDIGDRAGQEEQWLSTPEKNDAAAKAGRSCIWDPVELYCLLDDFSFEFFMEEYAKTFSEAQRSAGRRFLAALNGYEPKYFSALRPALLLQEPAWHLVQDAASKFVASFENSERDVAPEEQTSKEVENR